MMSALKRSFKIAFLGIIVFVTLSGYAEPASHQYTVGVDGMACPFCAYGIEKQLHKLPGVMGMETDIETGVVKLTVDESVTLNEDDVVAAVTKAGFSVREFTAAP